MFRYVGQAGSGPLMSNVRPHTNMFFAFQLVLALSLVVGGIAVVVLWLALLSLSFGGQSGLMPWVAAGVILYGLTFILVGAAVGVPGILWSNHLAKEVSPKWARLAKAPGWIGSIVLVIGLVAALAVLLVEGRRPKSSSDGPVIYRDAAASAALSASAVALDRASKPKP
jgi:hypothetical protein